MVTDLRELMRAASSHPPHDRADLASLVGAGRRRVRVRRARFVGGTTLAAGAIMLASTWWLAPGPADLTAAGVPRADGPVIGLSSARDAVEGQDYRELTSSTNEDLEADNGEYFDGVTDDGLVLFRQGRTATREKERYALMDPITGNKQWLADRPGLGEQSWAIELGTEQLVLVRHDYEEAGDSSRPVLDIYDRGTGSWRTIGWPGLPTNESSSLVRLGPDGRAYVTVEAVPSAVPEGGWPRGADGEADDADAAGDTSALWSVSLTDPSDVRDEGLRVGDFGFDGDTLVWTDSANGAAGRVHVRDLGTGDETSFDPGLGERCNLLGFDVASGRIALSQYCGTYPGGVRDDRVQVVTTDGERVITLQDSGVDGGNLIAGGDFMTLTAYGAATGGTYLYDFDDGSLLRLSEAHGVWAVGQGPTSGDRFMWNEPAGKKVARFGRSGAAVHLGELIR